MPKKVEHVNDDYDARIDLLICFHVFMPTSSSRAKNWFYNLFTYKWC